MKGKLHPTTAQLFMKTRSGRVDMCDDSGRVRDHRKKIASTVNATARVHILRNVIVKKVGIKKTTTTIFHEHKR